MTIPLHRVAGSLDVIRHAIQPRNLREHLVNLVVDHGRVLMQQGGRGKPRSSLQRAVVTENKRWPPQPRTNQSTPTAQPR
eukprot:12900676-Prorocentrum_lima.AAC.1